MLLTFLDQCECLARLTTIFFPAYRACESECSWRNKAQIRTEQIEKMLVMTRNAMENWVWGRASLKELRGSSGRFSKLWTDFLRGWNAKSFH